MASFSKGNIPWNAGLTSDTDVRVKKQIEKLNSRFTGF